MEVSPYLIPFGGPMSDDNVVQLKPRSGAKPESVKTVPAGVQILEKLLYDHGQLEEHVHNVTNTLVSLIEHLQEQGIIKVVDSETGEPDPGNLEEMAAQASAMSEVPVAPE